ncbi:ABC transporter ATP-binding protein [candidate division KSB1 bacterium]
MDNDKPIITIRGLRKAYSGEEYVLNGIDLDILPGQIIGYIGPNGAGKTTTVKILIGMISDFEGDITVLDKNIKTDPFDVKKNIGYVPENAILYENLTPIEYLSFIGQLYGLAKDAVEAKSKKLLELFDLSESADQRMSGFSKGMKQKVLIIGGILHNPDIIFLDEPLSGLDANTAIVIKEILAGLAKQGKTIFYCSHIMDVVERISDRIVIIDKGRIIADAPFDELQSMTKGGGSLEKIFSQLTGGEEKENVSGEFLDALNGEE